MIWSIGTWDTLGTFESHNAEAQGGVLVGELDPGMVSDENDDPSNYNGMKRIREMEREEKELERLAKSSFVGRRHPFFSV